jgi:hypothetical protein
VCVGNETLSWTSYTGSCWSRIFLRELSSFGCSYDVKERFESMVHMVMECLARLPTKMHDAFGGGWR